MERGAGSEYGSAPGGSAQGVFFWRWDAGKDGRERGKREREGGGWRRREEKMGFLMGIRASEYQGKVGTYVGMDVGR